MKRLVLVLVVLGAVVFLTTNLTNLRESFFGKGHGLSHAEDVGEDIVFGKEPQCEYFTSRLVGWSMFPTICNGDVITWRKVEFGRLKVGDVILFKEHHLLYDKVCHRVTYINEKGTALRTCGDNNRWPDSGWVTADEFVGIAVAVNGSAIPPKANSGWRMTNSEGQQDKVFGTTNDTNSCEANAGSLITAPPEN